MTEPRKLLTFEFVGLCLVTFLAFCNITVFYNLFNYLQTLGIPPELRGLVIGTYSLTAMVLYLVASPFLNMANAPRTILLGMVMMVASGLGYFFVHSFWGLLALRMLNGAGQFCTAGGAMTLFVTVIPPEKSGQAFGLYSVAILLAYAVVPTLMDTLVSLIPTPPHGYAATTVSMGLAARPLTKRGEHYPRCSKSCSRRSWWIEIRSRTPVRLMSETGSEMCTYRSMIS
jgi:MFS family permease